MVNFEDDAENYLKRAQEREEAEAGEKKVPCDPVGPFHEAHSVVIKEGRPYDAYMTKVDLKNGIYGDYVFYKM